MGDCSNGRLQAHLVHCLSLRSSNTGCSVNLPLKHHRSLRRGTLLLGLPIIHQITTRKLYSTGFGAFHAHGLRSPCIYSRWSISRPIRPQENPHPSLDPMGIRAPDLFFRRKLDTVNPRHILLGNINDRTSSRHRLRHHIRRRQEKTDISPFTSLVNILSQLHIRPSSRRLLCNNDRNALGSARRSCSRSCLHGNILPSSQPTSSKNKRSTR